MTFLQQTSIHPAPFSKTVATEDSGLKQSLFYLFYMLRILRFNERNNIMIYFKENPTIIFIQNSGYFSIYWIGLSQLQIYLGNS